MEKVDYRFNERTVIDMTKLMTLCLEKGWYGIGTAAELRHMAEDVGENDNITSADIYELAKNIMRHSDISSFDDEEDFLAACVTDIWKHAVKKIVEVEKYDPSAYKIREMTSVGELLAYPSPDPGHRGVHVDIKLDGHSSPIPLVRIEHEDDGSGLDGKGEICIRVWSGRDKEDCSYMTWSDNGI